MKLWASIFHQIRTPQQCEAATSLSVKPMALISQTGIETYRPTTRRNPTIHIFNYGQFDYEIIYITLKNNYVVIFGNDFSYFLSLIIIIIN